ncbi:hypothetical protein ABEB36_005187 [Hypothenemus hampei]|uniref:Uncharacterized protein n=1 Tax=Hypothenemus hampei TaxID=57062 RepID=A0ABD1EXX0_HYPHA
MLVLFVGYLLAAGNLPIAEQPLTKNHSNPTSDWQDMDCQSLINFQSGALILSTNIQTVCPRIANIADTNDTIVDIWTQANRILSFLLNKCLLSDIQDLHQLQGNGNAALTLEDCLKRRGLRALDRALSRDTIAITDNIVLVKRENVTNADNKIDR